MRKIGSILCAFLLLFCVIVPASAASYLIPGGQCVGLHLQDDTISVAAIDDTLGQAAKAAGLKIGDRLVGINGKPVKSSQDVKTALQGCEVAEVSILRNGKAKKLCFSPAQTEQGPKLGVYLKQGITGVGTVTYYDPESGTFGALGHGVSHPDGKLLSMETGDVFPASVLSVKKGKAGDPGQLMGAVTDTKPLGSLSKNTPRGVFGDTVCSQAQAIPTAKSKDVGVGSATIRCTVDGTALGEYSAEILKIYPESSDRTRNLLIKITDDTLLNATGGIVQGMSGSPIIQDGKLVGAVTHVLVNDPTTGYGIFIENMLDAAA